MRYFRLFFSIPVLFALAGCDFLDKKQPPNQALEGTETAIVGLYIDKDGYPQATTQKVNVYPGQKIIFAGPENFDIFFKDEKSPIQQPEVRSSNGIVIIEIPKDIFDRADREAKAGNKDELKELIYRYGIRANGKVTDPEIGVNRR